VDRPNNVIIEVRDVTFSYGGKPVLEHVTSEVGQREFVAVIGPNGGGKTTLIRLMMGLLQPRSGTIRMFGRPPIESRGRFGYTPQHTRFDDDFPVTVLDVVLMGRLGQGISLGPFRSRDREAAEAALDEVSCRHLRDRPLATLSGGERQRVLIARALTSQPEIIFLDEPSANLDPSIQDEFYDLLHRLNERMAVIIVSHDIGFVSRHVEKVMCVNRTVYLHPTSELKGEVLERLYRDMGVRIVDHDHSHGH
jgi:zinc transport system ATP-binding protein